MPAGVEEGIVRGIYKLSTRRGGGGKAPHVQLFGSGAILREVQRAQNILAEKYGVSSTVWSVTSYKELRRDASACRRWNMLHPTEKPRSRYFEKAIAGVEGPFIAASDYVRGVPEQIDPWVPGGLFVAGHRRLRPQRGPRPLRRFFEVDAESRRRGRADRGWPMKASSTAAKIAGGDPRPRNRSGESRPVCRVDHMPAVAGLELA